MKYVGISLLLLVICFSSCKHNQQVKRPSLVIGLVVDQMRWDYLYRYYNRYGNDGFKRLLHEGYSCENTKLNYLPTHTGPGHSCIYTGSVPAIHGIAANDWIENTTGKSRYCVDDSLVFLTDAEAKTISMSPRSLLVTTITDELRLATNMESRTYGIAIKDRGAILPAGHLANGAYWYNDKTGNFTTSTYYNNQHPDWLKKFNARKYADSLVKKNWYLLNPAKDYNQSTVDATNYEKGFSGEKAPVFPHIFDTCNDKYRLGVLKTIPAGNTLTLMMAKACLEGEHLGKNKQTDFLAISLSSTDYCGHQFAPNSLEIEDMYIRLDKEIASFLRYLDRMYGCNNYLLFLTADHGGAHNATFLQDLDIPSGVSNPAAMTSELNMYLRKEVKELGKKEYLKDSLVIGTGNNQVSLNYKLIDNAKLDKDKIKTLIIQWLNKRPELEFVIDMENMNKTSLPEPIKTLVVNGYNRFRSGEIQLIPNPAWYDGYGKTTGTTHGNWNPYDTHIPLIWYGWHICKGSTNHPVDMTDISATLAALLHIQMPNGCIGKPIAEIAK